MTETIDLVPGSDGAWAAPDKPATSPIFKTTAEGVAWLDGRFGPEKPPEPIITPTIDYNELPQMRLCSANTCSNGHEWPPVIQLTRCPGCGSPLLAVKMLNCPVCNEPCEAIRLRSDHLPQGGAIMPMCRGSASLAEVQVIEMRRGAAAKEESIHKEREMISKV